MSDGWLVGWLVWYFKQGFPMNHFTVCVCMCVCVSWLHWAVVFLGSICAFLFVLFGLVPSISYHVCVWYFARVLIGCWWWLHWSFVYSCLSVYESVVHLLFWDICIDHSFKGVDWVQYQLGLLAIPVNGSWSWVLPLTKKWLVLMSTD